jgi:DNA invertase Pin-like site-specific DNA recombinase
MSGDAKLSASHLARQAVLYVRQSTLSQVHGNLESQRRQYGLVEHARALGFPQVEVIDQDLGRSASGSAERPGFERLVALVLSGQVGAVVCIEASRLARNGRDWHHLLDLCALCDTLIIDPEGIYDPRQSNDRLLLGLKGSLSEFELSLLSQRAGEARKQKAARGELQFRMPVGLQWTPQGQIELDPDLRVQQAMRLVFRKFTELGTVMAVLRWFVTQQLPVPSCKRKKHQVLQQHWEIPHYSTLMCIYKNPLYAGAYAYGKSRARTRIVEHRALKSRGHRKPLSEWSVLLLSHHPGYISWSEYLRNQQMLKEHTHQDKAVDRKAGRGGNALLAGMIRCRRCGQRMGVHYRSPSAYAYRCQGSSSLRLGKSCLNLGGYHIDERVGAELVQALTPYAIEAALMAAKKQQQARRDVQSALQLEREQASYQVELAARRYEEVDPHNRLVALELERRWEQALSHLEELDRRLQAVQQQPDTALEPDGEQLFELARDLSAVWNDPNAEPALKQRLASLLLVEVLCEVDGPEIVLVLHWQGGRHSQVRLPKPAPGQHRNRTDRQVHTLLGKQSPTLSFQELSNLLNQHGLKTRKGHRWDAVRVRGFMAQHRMGRYQGTSALEGTLTVPAVARRLGISNTAVRHLIARGLLLGEQRYARAFYRIPAEALERAEVKAAVQAIHRRRPGCSQPQQSPYPKDVSEKDGV